MKIPYLASCFLLVMSAMLCDGQLFQNLRGFRDRVNNRQSGIGNNMPVRTRMPNNRGQLSAGNSNNGFLQTNNGNNGQFRRSNVQTQSNNRPSNAQISQILSRLMNNGLFQNNDRLSGRNNGQSQGNNEVSPGNNALSVRNGGFSVGNNGQSRGNNGVSPGNNALSVGNSGLSGRNNGQSRGNNGVSPGNNALFVRNSGFSAGNSGSSARNNRPSRRENGQSQQNNGLSQGNNGLLLGNNGLSFRNRGLSRENNGPFRGNNRQPGQNGFSLRNNGPSRGNNGNNRSVPGAGNLSGTVSTIGSGRIATNNRVSTRGRSNQEHRNDLVPGFLQRFRNSVGTQLREQLSRPPDEEETQQDQGTNFQGSSDGSSNTFSGQGQSFSPFGMSPAGFNLPRNQNIGAFGGGGPRIRGLGPMWN